MSLIDLIKEEYVLYILGDKGNARNFCMSDLGVEVCYVDPLNGCNNVFVDLLLQVDGIGYGEKNLSMDRWVALDCGMLPSAFVGLAKKACDLSKDTRAKLSIPKDYDGFVPVTMYCAIPSVERGLWISHSLSSIDNGKGLGLATKIIGLMVYGAERIRGIAQYDNSSVKIHSKIADLKLVSAITFVHSIPEMTFIYEHDVDKDRLVSVLEGRTFKAEPSFLLDPKDIDKKKEMQEFIYSGAKDFYVVYPGITNNGLVPIIEREK